MSFPTFPRWLMHEVRDWQQLYVVNENGTKELNLVTTTLINYTILIGVSKITDDNVDDVSCRVALLESVNGTVLRAGEKRIFITRDDVARHIGLRTESAEIELAEFWAQTCKLNRQAHSVALREANGNTTALYSMYRLSSH
jgi:hypothetical protein